MRRGEGKHTTLPRSSHHRLLEERATSSRRPAGRTLLLLRPAASEDVWRRRREDGAEADVHCAADAAFLCGACDAEVHGANFLAARHRRTRVSAVKGRDDGVSGTSSASASSSCVSTADSATTTVMAPQRGRSTRPRRTRRGKGEAVLERWANRMGIVAPGAARRPATAAARALHNVAAAPRMPLRVAMAGALWREVAFHEADGHALQACANVPARVVVAVASSMRRARVKRAAAGDTEEGWGEYS